MRFRSASFFFLLPVLALPAHPELDAALQRINARVAASPQAAALYLERGEIYLGAGDLLTAEANFQVAAELDPQLPRLDRARATLALSRRQPADAIRLLEGALRRNPADAEARILRARSQLASGHSAAAGEDFAAALALLEQPAPEIFLEYAACAANPIEAIRRLDAGCARLGAVPALLERALALEESAGLIDHAVSRLDRIIARVERPESWLKRRGDLLQRAGRPAEAGASYAAARTAIGRLPDWLQESPATTRLKHELVDSAPSLSLSP